MMNVYEWFAGLATIAGFLYFLAGFLAAYAIHSVRCRMRHKSVKVEWRIGGIAVGIVAIMLTSFQAQAAYSTAQQTAKDARDCQIEFNNALTERAKITTENDALSQEQRTIVFNWIHDLIFPPPPYAELDPNDPKRQAWTLLRTQDTDREFQQSINRQDDLQQKRKDHPYPDPTCGRP